MAVCRQAALDPNNPPTWRACSTSLLEPTSTGLVGSVPRLIKCIGAVGEDDLVTRTQ